MLHRQLLSGCIYTLLLFFGFTLSAQLPEKLPTLVINEVHIESLEDNNYFIEFVVTETNRIPYDKNHDSPSLIVDDSNTSSSAQAGFLTIEPNALRTVKRGDLVVVHGNGANTSMAGTDVVLLDFDSDLIGKWQGAPNPITGTYEDATKVIVGDHLITDYISFTGSGNILQTRVSEMNINQIELNGASNYSLNGNNLSEYGVLSSSLGNPNCGPNSEMIDALGSSSQMYVYCTQSNDFDIKVEIVGGRAPFAIERPNGALWQGIENRLAVSYSHECGEVELLIYDSNNNSPPASCKVTVGIPAVDDLGKINQNVLLCNRSFDPKLDLCPNLESNCVVYKINSGSWEQITSIDQLPVDFDDSDVLEIKLYNDNQIQLHHYVFNFTVREDGQACNDNNICTINDKYNSDCYCEGESDIL